MDDHAVLNQHELQQQHLLDQIDRLKHERVDLVNQVEAEEEYITNVLQKRLEQLQREKVELETALEVEQERMVNKLQKEMETLRGSGSVGCSGSGGEELKVVETLKFQLDRQRVRFSEREQDLQRQVSALQAENHHLLQENIRLSQRLRRHSGSFSGDEHSQSPPRHHQPHQPHQQQEENGHGSKSGSISDLRRHSLSDSEGNVVGRSRSKSQV